MARYSVNNYTVETLLSNINLEALQSRRCSALLFGIALKSEIWWTLCIRDFQ